MAFDSRTLVEDTFNDEAQERLVSRYDAVFQEHARVALAHNPYEPLVMLRPEKDSAAHVLAMPADEVIGTSKLTQIGLV